MKTTVIKTQEIQTVAKAPYLAVELNNHKTHTSKNRNENKLMSDPNKVVQITDFKVSITHQIDNLNLVLDTPYFSEINNYFNNTKKEGEPVKQHLTLNSLLERLNTIKQKTDKRNSIAILKGLYKDGTSGVYCYKDTPFLFFDIDVKEKENAQLLDAYNNAEVFRRLQDIAIMVWRSNSGKGIAGILHVPQLAEVNNRETKKHLAIGKAICDYIKNSLNINADFDNAQSKYRQVRYLACQNNDIYINQNPYAFNYDATEIARTSETGVKQFRHESNRAPFGTIEYQFNQDNNIHTALLDNGFTQTTTNRYKHSRTESKDAGAVGDNLFFNYSTSFSNLQVFTPFKLYLTESYSGDLRCFSNTLRAKGYKDKKPQAEAFKLAEKRLKEQGLDREEQIFTVCYDLLTADYEDRVNFAENNANNETEKTKFHDYLKVKPLAIHYDKTLHIKKFVSEQLKSVLDYADFNQKLILTAETGTGKTTAFLKEFEKYRPNKRLLILVPLTVIVAQTKSEFPNIIGLTSNSEPNDHAKAKKAPIVIATYEQGYKHLKDPNTFSYVVIDEVHNLITANSYKRDAIRNLTSLLGPYKVIGLTGTSSQIFTSIGYKLMHIKKENLMPVDISMIIDNRTPLKIALQHLENVKGKCILRVNNRNIAKDLKTELLKLKKYTDKEILILNSDNHVKKSKDFIQLTTQGKFNDTIRLVITTSIIDEVLSIKQSGFTDTVFIETDYRPMPVSVKQFVARFRNEDTERKNYFYFRETKDQTSNSWDPSSAFYQTKKELLEDVKGRNSTESESKDIANNDYLFYANSQVNEYALGYDIETTFFNKLTTLEYIRFLEINYNLSITINTAYKKKNIDLKDTKENRNIIKKKIGYNWVNNKDEVLNTLFRLTDNRDVKNTIDFIGLNASDEICDLVYENIKEFERLHKSSTILEKLETENIDSKIIDFETMKPVSPKVVNSKIRLLQNLNIIKNPKTVTDKKNKEKLLSFISKVSKLESFNSAVLLRLWKQQRTQSVNFNADNLKELVLHYHSFTYDKKGKKWQRNRL